MPRAPKTKREPAFPPAPRCRHPLACPSGRRARRSGGRQCSTNRQGRWNPAFQRSLGVRWPVTGTGAAPKSCGPASMSLRSLCALRRAGIAVRSSIDTIPKVVSLDHLASVLLPEGFQFRRGCGCIFPAMPKGIAAPLQPAPPGPKTGFASMASGPFPLPEGIDRFPTACHPRHEAKGCHWTPVRSVPAKPMRTSPSWFPGVASPSRSARFPEGTCTVRAVTNI